jgi:ABC-type antimicrobial peptide transport system permease subunit
MTATNKISVLRLVASAIRYQYRRFLVLAIVSGLAMVAAVAGLTISSFSAASTTAITGDKSQLSKIAIFNDVSSLPFSSIDDIRRVRGVASVSPIIRVPVGLNESRSSLILVGTDEPTVAPILAGSVPVKGLPAGTIVLPSQADGVDLRQYLRHEVSLTYTVGITADSGITKNLPLDLVAVYDASYQVDAPIAGYVSLSTAEQLAVARAGVTKDAFESTMGFSQIDVSAKSVELVPAVTRALQAKGYHAVSEVQRLQQVPGAISLLHGAALVLFGLLLVLAVASAALVANSIASERVREIAILRACGWPHGKVMTLLLGEAGLVVTLSCLLGGALGAALAFSLGAKLRQGLVGNGLGPMVFPWDQIVASAVVFIVLVGFSYATAIVRTTRKPISAVLQGTV